MTKIWTPNDYNHQFEVDDSFSLIRVVKRDESDILNSELSELELFNKILTECKTSNEDES